MDLNALDTGRASDEGATLHLKHPVEGTPLMEGDQPQTITLAGSDSRLWRKSQFELFRRRAKESRRRGGVLPPEVLEEEAVELLAAATLDWNKIIVNGEELRCSKENAVRLYTKYRWIREQVDEFIGDLGNFLKPSQTSSETSQNESSD